MQSKHTSPSLLQVLHYFGGIWVMVKIWHCLFFPRGFENADLHIVKSWISMIHLTVNSILAPVDSVLSSSSGQIDGFCAWEFVFCIKWCWETEPHGKMAFHNRVPTWHSPKWVRLTDQGVFIIHFEKNQDVHRAVWWPSVCLCIGLFDNLFGLHVYYLKNKSIEGIILPGRRQFSEGCLFPFLTHDSFATSPDRYNQVTSFKCLPMGVKAIISNLL